MTRDQEADFVYNEQKLIRLLVRRHNLPTDSTQAHELTVEIGAVENLVRSYRIVKQFGA